MPNQYAKLFALLAAGLVSLALSLMLSSCGNGLIAPEGPKSNAFLNQLDANCGTLNIGDQPINYLLDINNEDTYFIDEASKLAAGEIDQATFASDINAFYPTGSNGRALQCIVAQLSPSAP
ncbi:hypothetical protein [Rhabdochromatium marinum]|uniref:hypothetical protein n=1 Tax=Rhabdochromatium marinum TaxID=48729 RepID=UPI001903F758|nr:hypothetical protein [Rhabdochromatium marinum]MBK1648194.1 hypothetical protein [Rhabdochromatium marinum]